DRHRGGVGEPVGGPDDEGLEGVLRVEPGLQRAAGPGVTAAGRRGVEGVVGGLAAAVVLRGQGVRRILRPGSRVLDAPELVAKSTCRQIARSMIEAGVITAVHRVT